MRRLFLILSFLYIPFSLFAQEWQWLYPYPTTNKVIDFYFTDKDNGFIIAENGEIIKTNDGCLTWETITMGDVTLIDIFCMDNNNAWILGNKYGGWSYNYIILKTDDGGKNWTENNISSYSGSFNCIYFISESKGWIAGSYGSIKMTTNGGVSWIDKSISGDNDPNILFINFTDDQNGTIIGDNNGIIIGKTSNGGSSWTLNIAGIKNTFYGGHFAGENTYYTVGERGLILKTNNQGSSWSFPSNIIQKSLYSISFSDPLTGWAVGEDSTLIKTADGGETWNKQSIGFTSNFIDVKFHDNSTGWILGSQDEYDTQSNQTFLFTDDAGKNWENKFRTFNEIMDFADVCFIDSINGWIISPNQIYRTHNGAKTWELQYMLSTGGNWYYEYINSICFVDSLKGFCVGSNSSSKGTILKTTNGGKGWTSQAYAFGPLRDVCFTSKMTGWFVGDDGIILRTLNGGSSLEYLTSGTTNDIVSVYFLDENHGWAVTSSNTILRSSDGGLNWLSSTFSTNSYDYGQSVFFCDTLTGFVGTANGLFKTTNGGKNFNKISLTSYENIVDIYFANNQEGWALANYSGWSGTYGGIIYYTEDGGSMWNEVFSSGKNFSAISFIPEGYAWIVGGNSTIAKYNHGKPLTAVNMKKSNIGPTEYQLYQCYPNPFNPSTTISYDLPEKVLVELKIYDTLGREVMTLVNEVKDMGRHQINLDLQNLASGTYFYQLKTNSFTKTKKLMLLK